MNAISTLALIAASTALLHGTPLRAAETNGRFETAFNRPLAYHPRFGDGAIKAGEKASAQVNVQTEPRLQDKVAAQFVSPLRPEAGAQPGVAATPKIEPRTAQPNEVVRLESDLNLQYSGILVQAVRHNPLQLLNPFAPAQYGDGEANTVRGVTTGQAVGLKVLGIRF